MKKELRMSQSLKLSDLPCQENDHTVLHRAATILRKIISNVAVLDDYPNPSQLSLEASSDLVPAELYRFILWLLLTMKRCQEMTASLGQIHPIQTMDQQLYAIAQQVK